MSLIILLSLILIKSLAVSEINCEQPKNDLQVQYCNTRQLIQLYNRKLRILEQTLNIVTPASNESISIPPLSSNPNLYTYNTLFSGQTVLISPDKVLNKNTFRTLDGKQIAKISEVNILAVGENQITLHQNNKTKAIIFKPKGRNYSEVDSYGIYDEGIKGFHIGKSPRVLIQYRNNELWIHTKSGIYKTYNFDTQILSVTKGYNSQAVYITRNQYGIISAVDQNPKHQTFMLDSVLNATSDFSSYVYILTAQGELVTIDLKTHNQIGYSQLFPPNSLKTELSVCEKKLLVHRQTEPFILIFNTTDKNHIRLLDNITICKTNNHTKFRYQTSCDSNTLLLLCGSGIGDDSEWKFGRYLFKVHTPTPYNSKYIYPALAVLTFVMFFVYKSYTKKKHHQKVKFQIEEEDEEEIMQKIGGENNSRSSASTRSKKNN